MNIEALKSGLERSQATAQPISLPPACYVEDAVVLAEQTKLFREGWFGVGRSDQVKEPGDFLALDVAGQSIILLRDRAGTLQAFANTCRHRAMRLLDGSGNCRSIRCPFHAWTYRLDGSLVAAVHMEEAPGFDKSENGLIAYRAEERSGFAFVCLNTDAPSLDTVLGDFATIHAPWPLDTLVSTRREVMEVACNWKAFLEVFNEYYHLPFVHPNSIGDVYASPDAPENVAGAFVTQFGATKGTGGLLQDEQDQALPSMPGLQGREAAGVRYTWVFPNMTFAAGTDALWVYEAYPLGPNRCKVVQTACFPPETLADDGAAAKVEAYHNRLDAALAEDIPALEIQYHGLAHPDARQGFFHPTLEPNVAGFARWYATQMIEAL
ncbi:MAG: aromatic ring-hydroxylating dioxygenase subunit alpha [Pseudomonadota bacterium]